MSTPSRRLVNAGTDTTRATTTYGQPAFRLPEDTIVSVAWRTWTSVIPHPKLFQLFHPRRRDGRRAARRDRGGGVGGGQGRGDRRSTPSAKPAHSGTAGLSIRSARPFDGLTCGASSVKPCECFGVTRESCEKY
jgi:hypothetical protein